jgi:hypothetical protein
MEEPPCFRSRRATERRRHVQRKRAHARYCCSPPVPYRVIQAPPSPSLKRRHVSSGQKRHAAAKRATSAAVSTLGMDMDGGHRLKVPPLEMALVQDRERRRTSCAVRPPHRQRTVSTPAEQLLSLLQHPADAADFAMLTLRYSTSCLCPTWHPCPCSGTCPNGMKGLPSPATTHKQRLQVSSVLATGATPGLWQQLQNV